MKVFVIEDNPVYNDYVCNLLKKDSFDTMSAYNLATAKKLLAKSEVDDIVVADLRLPDGESIELLRWMRANDKQQVFIVMTNYGEVHTAVESMKLGSKDYIQKQLLEDKLIPLIRTLQKEHEKRLQWNIPIFVRQGEVAEVRHLHALEYRLHGRGRGDKAHVRDPHRNRVKALVGLHACEGYLVEGKRVLAVPVEHRCKIVFHL